MRIDLRDDQLPDTINIDQHFIIPEAQHAIALAAAPPSQPLPPQWGKGLSIMREERD
jgi:hypothetical protein